MRSMAGLASVTRTRHDASCAQAGHGHGSAQAGHGDVGGQSPVGAEAVGAAVDALGRALVAAAGAEDWTTSERHGALEAVDRAASTLTALRARLLAAEQATGTWALHGDRTLAAWRARTSRQGADAGAAQVRQADAVSTLPRVAHALASGAVTTAHLDAIARLSTSGSQEVARRVASDEGQAHLVALAERLDGAAYAKALARWQAELDPATRQRAHDEQQAARYLHLSHAPGGTVLKGLVDRVAGHRLQLALEAVSPRPALDDVRSPEQRRADALVALADRALDDPSTVTGAAVRPHVSLLVGESTWASLRGSQHQPPIALGRVHRTSSGGTVPVTEAPSGGATPVAGAPSGGTTPVTEPPSGGAIQVAGALVGHPAVCDEEGSPWPASEVARVLCDCRLSRVVMGADSVPLDLGRTHRLFTGAQRRAATVRDGGCGWPSCPAAARWCELHHIRWWDRDGGASDLENAVLLCTYHHHLVHRRELTITRLPRGSTAPPSGEHRLRARYRFTDHEGRAVTDPIGREATPVTDPTGRDATPVTDPTGREGYALTDGWSPPAPTRPSVVGSAARHRLAPHAVRPPTVGPTLWELS